MSVPTARILAETLGPLVAERERAALLFDIDGTLAPIVERPEDARVPERTTRLLGALVDRYRCVACISGRSAIEARRLVGIDSLGYAGIHGAELLRPGAERPALSPSVAAWVDRIRRFAGQQAENGLQPLGIRMEDKGAIAAFHWRAANDEEAARQRVGQIADEAETAGLYVHWGRKVLEVRPPVPIDKGRAVREIIGSSEARACLFAGDDRTDLDGFDGLDALIDEGALDFAIRVGVRSDEGPPEIAQRADLVVEGTTGVVEVLEALAG